MDILKNCLQYSLVVREIKQIQRKENRICPAHYWVSWESPFLKNPLQRGHNDCIIRTEKDMLRWMNVCKSILACKGGIMDEHNARRCFNWAKDIVDFENWYTGCYDGDGECNHDCYSHFK